MFLFALGKGSRNLRNLPTFSHPQTAVAGLFCCFAVEQVSHNTFGWTYRGSRFSNIMAVIRPFRAFRSDSHLREPLSDRTAPLWESLTAEQIADLRLKKENAVHLSVPASTELAVQIWNEWRNSGTVLQDPLPALYPWFQRFSLFGTTHLYERRGFVALVRLNQKGTPDDVVVHEDTLAPVVQERAKYLRALPLNVTPVHGLYYDPYFEIEKRLEPYADNPWADLMDPQGVRHSLSIMQHPDDVSFIAEHMANKTIYLADGHHRLQTSGMYRDYIEAQGIAKTQVHQYIMMYLTNYAADDLRILPTHRLVELVDNFDEQAFRNALQEYFNIETFDSRTPLPDQLKGDSHAFGLLFDDRQILIRLKPELDTDTLIQLDVPSSVKRLGYTILHDLLIDRLLGIPYAEQNSSSRISYIKDFAAVHRAVHSGGKRQMGILVNEVSMAELLAVCNDGARMPQKSTYFFPKVISGLLYASLQDHDNLAPVDPRF